MRNCRQLQEPNPTSASHLLVSVKTCCDSASLLQMVSYSSVLTAVSKVSPRSPAPQCSRRCNSDTPCLYACRERVCFCVWKRKSLTVSGGWWGWDQCVSFYSSVWRFLARTLRQVAPGDPGHVLQPSRVPAPSFHHCRINFSIEKTAPRQTGSGVCESLPWRGSVL